MTYTEVPENLFLIEIIMVSQKLVSQTSKSCISVYVSKRVFPELQRMSFQQKLHSKKLAGMIFVAHVFLHITVTILVYSALKKCLLTYQKRELLTEVMNINVQCFTRK